MSRHASAGEGKRRPFRARAFAAALLLGALALGNAPYLFGYAIRPPETLFWAVPSINYSDACQYLAFTRLLLEGGWLAGDPFTAEPHAPRLFLPLSLLEAGLCRLTGLAPLEVFQVSRVACGAALLAAAAWFGRELLPRRRLRRLYLLLLVSSGGASWLAERAGWWVPNGDLLQPEGNTLFLLGNLPSLCLAAALLTALVAAAARLAAGPKRQLSLAAGVAAPAALLSWMHPFDFATLGLTLGLYAAVRWRAEGRFPRGLLRYAAAVLAGAAPAAIYLSWLLATDPFYRALAADSSRVQGFAFYAIAHGPLALPAALVLFHARLRRRYALPLCWAGGVFLFLATPFGLGGKQARLIGGIHAPLALLCAVGLDYAARWVALRPPRCQRGAASRARLRRIAARAAVAGYVALLASGGWGILQRHLAVYAARLPDHYLSPAVQALYRELEREGNRSQVTLAGPYTASWAPVLADTRLYHGHWHLTLHAPRKRAERDAFFTMPGPPELRADWLRRNGITWIIAYPIEWYGAMVPLDDLPGLRPVFVSPEIRLYRFRAEAGEGSRAALAEP